jgi:hypothetical protein
MEIPMQTTKVYEFPIVEGFAHTKHYLVYSEEQCFLQILQIKNNSLIHILPREVKPTEFYALTPQNLWWTNGQTKSGH